MARARRRRLGQSELRRVRRVHAKPSAAAAPRHPQPWRPPSATAAHPRAGRHGQVAAAAAASQRESRRLPALAAAQGGGGAAGAERLLLRAEAGQPAPALPPAAAGRATARSAAAALRQTGERAAPQAAAQAAGPALVRERGASWEAEVLLSRGGAVVVCRLPAARACLRLKSKQGRPLVSPPELCLFPPSSSSSCWPAGWV